jgi:hypothetical protein
VCGAKALPAQAASAYERVRADVMAGQARPDAVGAIVFHGMWQGLGVLLETPASPSPQPLPTVSPLRAGAPTGTPDRQLVRLLADMVLALHSSEVIHDQ